MAGQEGIKAVEGKHGENRLCEYDQVGRLLGDRTMRDFSGKAGGKLIAQLAAEWRFMRFVRGKRDGAPYRAPNKPIEDQTLRLRLSALDRLIAYAMDQMPEALGYVGPQKPMDYTAPAAHGNKRKRLPSIDEFAALLQHFGTDSGLGDFLRVIDETGCRLSEVSLAQGSRSRRRWRSKLRPSADRRHRASGHGRLTSEKSRPCSESFACRRGVVGCCLVPAFSPSAPGAWPAAPMGNSPAARWWLAAKMHPRWPPCIAYQGSP